MYKVKNKKIDVVTVYDSHGKAYILRKNQTCVIDKKPESTRLIVEEIKVEKFKKKLVNKYGKDR